MKKVLVNLDPRLIGIFIGCFLLFLGFILDNPLIFPAGVLVFASILFVRDLLSTKEERGIRFLIGMIFLLLLLMFFLSRIGIVQVSVGTACFLLAPIFLSISNIIYKKFRKKRLRLLNLDFLRGEQNEK